MDNVRKDILVFIDWFKPAYKAGGPVQSLDNMVRRLNDRYRFRIVTSNREYLETDDLEGVEPNCWTQYDDHVEVYYAKGLGALWRVMRAVLKNPDWRLVYLNSMYSWKFTILPLLMAGRDKQIILAPRGMLSEGSMGVKSTKKQTFVRLFRTLGLFRKVRFHATSAIEVEDIKRNIKTYGSVVQAGNLPRHIDKTWSKRTKESGQIKLVFLGRVAREKNLHFAIQCLSFVTSRVVLDIVGSVYDEQYWTQCQKTIATLPENITVHLKGPHPADDIPELLLSYHALLLPSTGENFGHAIVEALAMGLPVLISDRTPWRHLSVAGVGFDLPLTDPKPYGTAIDNLAGKNREEWSVISQRAFDYGRDILKAEESLRQNYRLFQVD